MDGPVAYSRMDEQRIRYAFRAFCIAAVVLMAIAAAYRIPVEVSRLVFEPRGHGAAKDLLWRYAEVKLWFAGSPLYGVMESADYPPASYMILAPFVRWPTPEILRVVWAFLSLAALSWLSVIFVRAFDARDNVERTFAALLPFAGYATAATLRLGRWACCYCRCWRPALCDSPLLSLRCVGT